MFTADKLMKLFRKYRNSIQICAVCGVVSGFTQILGILMLAVMIIIRKPFVPLIYTFIADLIIWLISFSIVQSIKLRTFSESGFRRTKTGKKCCEILSAGGCSEKLISELYALLSETKSQSEKENILSLISDSHRMMCDYKMAFETAMRLDPSSSKDPAGIYMQLLELYTETGDLDSADKVAYNIQGFMPAYEAYYNKYLSGAHCYAKYLKAKGFFPESLDLLNAVMHCFSDFGAVNASMNQQIGLVNFDIGECLYFMGRYAEAMPHISTAVNLLSGLPARQKRAEDLRNAAVSAMQ